MEANEQPRATDDVPAHEPGVETFGRRRRLRCMRPTTGRRRFQPSRPAPSLPHQAPASAQRTQASHGVETGRGSRPWRIREHNPPEALIGGRGVDAKPGGGSHFPISIIRNCSPYSSAEKRCDSSSNGGSLKLSRPTKIELNSLAKMAGATATMRASAAS